MNTDHNNRPGGNRQNEDDILNDGYQHDHPASRHIHFDINYDYGERYNNEKDWENLAADIFLSKDSEAAQTGHKNGSGKEEFITGNAT